MWKIVPIWLASLQNLRPKTRQTKMTTTSYLRFRAGMMADFFTKPGLGSLFLQELMLVKATYLNIQRNIKTPESRRSLREMSKNCNHRISTANVQEEIGTEDIQRAISDQE